MMTTRRGGDLAKSLHMNKRARSAGKETSNKVWDSNQYILTKLSDEVASYLSKSVISIALSNGDTVLFACSGIAIERQGYITRFLTSASLVKALNGAKEHLKIEVRHGGNEVHTGFLVEYDLDQNFAVVNIMTFLDVHVVLLKCAEEILPHSNIIALRRDISGNIITKSVSLAGDLSKPEDSEELMQSRCDPEGWEGGPLFDFDGNFVGMNVNLVMERSFFLPWRIVIKKLEHIWTSLQEKRCVPHVKTLKEVRLDERPALDISNCHPEEEPFGDVFGQGIWKELHKRVSSNMQRSVVALASFHGETLFFACTGFVIKWDRSTVILTSASLVRSSGSENKIEENLRIELYTNEGRTPGTLQHYSLHYNVAIVSVKDHCPLLRPVKIQLQYYMCSKVAAVGRCFKSGKLMAANGLLVDWTGTLDCEFLARASCKISKVGIGGPLVNFDGEVIGMNFYDKKIGTPFLLWKEICKILAHFKDTGKSTAVEASNGGYQIGVPFWKMDGDDSCRPNRWPVTVPFRRRCDDMDEGESEDDDESEDEDESELPSGSVGRYTYINGKRYLYRNHRPLDDFAVWNGGEPVRVG